MSPLSVSPALIGAALALGLSGPFASAALAQKEVEGLPIPVQENIEEGFDTLTPAQEAAMECHLSYEETYQNAAQKTYPRAPDISPKPCPSARGGTALYACKPTGRWADIARAAANNPLFVSTVPEDADLEYTCKDQPEASAGL